MRKILVFGFVFLLMFSLVAGAGYNIVVPSATTDTSSPSSGGSSTTTITNNTANDTDVADDADDDESGDDDVVTRGIGEAVEFIKKLGWKAIVLTLVSLAVIGGCIWYFLRDRRKGFVQIKVKGKK